ncbi:cyclin-dependent kinase inhibitor [Trifolium repens]|nr:cyclin-dependent kinase inhibitor [Trifolium repens]
MTQLGKRTRRSQAPQIMSNEPPSTKNINSATVNVFAHPPVDECYSSITEESSSASCCSSNKLSDGEVESAQVETLTCNGDQIIRRREMGLLNEVVGTNSTEQEEEEVDSAENKPQKMPTESELDEFFSAAEKHVQKQFQNKYNFDIAKDMPLEGRYEWVQLKP